MTRRRTFIENNASPPTPKTSRKASFIGRVLRSHSNQQEPKKITSYFPVRKRHSEVKEKDVDCLGKRLRRGINITDVNITSPLEPYPGTSPCREPEIQDELMEIGSPMGLALSPQVAPSALGVFDQLPSHLIHMFIDRIPASRLVSLSLSSHEWSRRISEYIHTNACRNRFVREALSFKEVEESTIYFTHLDPFHIFGELLKALSVCQSTNSRILSLIRYCERILPFVDDLYGVGRMIHTMCSKWAFSECAKVLRAILRMNGSRLEKAIKQLMPVPHGTYPELEMQLRTSLCALVLGGRRTSIEDSTRENAFWLSALLRSQTSVGNQGKLLMVLYAPVTVLQSGKTIIDWRSLCESSVVSFEDAVQRIQPLSEALYRLMQTKKVGEVLYIWSQNDIFNIIEEISTFPEPWSFDNFVSLLIHRTSLIPVSIIARMNHGYEEEAGQMFNAMKMLLFRWGLDVCNVLNEPMTYTMRCLSGLRRRALFDSIFEAHSRQLKECARQGPAGESDLEDEIRSHAVVASLLCQIGGMV